MNQQEKELLLKDLCSRLPYGVEMYVEASSNIPLSPNSTTWKLWGGALDTMRREGFNMPVLHPITCLTQEITVNGETFVPIFTIMALRGYSYYCIVTNSEEPNDLIFKLFNNEGETLNDEMDSLYLNFSAYWDLPFFVTDVLNRSHINFRLPDHLFVPVTETFNPYRS